jgi:hypothetical protein
MPMRLEGLYSKLNKQNMKRRLYDIYTWQQGRADANRSEYANWLSEVADWMESKAEEKGVSTGAASKAAKKVNKPEKKVEAEQKEEGQQ